MSRVQHSKPSRRWGWAAAALVLLALPATAQAQGFFFLFGSPSPYEIERRLAAAGYVAHRPADACAATSISPTSSSAARVRSGWSSTPRAGASSSAIAAAPIVGARPRAPPPSAWSDDPRLWNGPRPPAAIGPDVAPPDAFEPPKPERPRGAEGRRPSPSRRPPRPSRSGRPSRAPVANVNNPPPAAVVPPRPRRPPPRRRRRFVVARGRSGFAEPGAERRRGAGESRSGRVAVPAPSVEAAKADAPSVAKPPPPAAAPAKSKAVNDIPVTPLD